MSGEALTSSLSLQFLHHGLHVLQLGEAVDRLSRAEPGQMDQEQQEGDTPRHG